MFGITAALKHVPYNFACTLLFQCGFHLSIDRRLDCQPQVGVIVTVAFIFPLAEGRHFNRGAKSTWGERHFHEGGVLFIRRPASIYR